MQAVFRFSQCDRRTEDLGRYNRPHEAPPIFEQSIQRSGLDGGLRRRSPARRYRDPRGRHLGRGLRGLPQFGFGPRRRRRRYADLRRGADVRRGRCHASAPPCREHQHDERRNPYPTHTELSLRSC